MARAPSYDFERRERQKAKDAKRAEKAQGKRAKKEEEASAVQTGQATSETEGAVAEDTAKSD